jgi:hypothetical protein
MKKYSVSLTIKNTRWLITVILASWEAEIRKIMVRRKHK